MKYFRLFIFSFCILAMGACTSTQSQEAESSTTPKKMKALIIDGENNHGIWPKTTIMMKAYLEETGLFDVDIARTAYTWQGPHHNVEDMEDITQLLKDFPIEGASTTAVKEPQADPDFNPDFSKYDLLISNLGWKASTWPDQTKSNFINFVANGGGLIVVHAANNSFGDWPEYNEMIGLGGWGGRNTESGPYVYYDEEGKLNRDTSVGACGSHGPQFEYVLQNRAPEHPIMKGLPTSWLHTKDELYDRLRGPAENMTVLATAYSDVEGNAPPWDKEVPGTGRHEPQLMAIEYQKGRVFHTVMGHMDYSMECVGFIATFQRGAEWAATGEVTQEVPKDFPRADEVSARAWQP